MKSKLKLLLIALLLSAIVIGGGCQNGVSCNPKEDELTNPVYTTTITAEAGANGSMSPTGAVKVNSGNNMTFVITPNSGYHVADVLVDDASVGAVSTYTFTNIRADHTISASFAANTSAPVTTLTITVSTGSNGSITPSGAVSVDSGSSQTFTITASSDYHVADVLVDGASVGTVASYTFTNVTANHTISASFVVNASTTPTTTQFPLISPVLEYRFEEGSGNRVSNTGSWAATLGAHGTVNGPIYSGDRPPNINSNYSMSFDGINDYILIPDDFNYTDDGGKTSASNPLTHLTIEVWIKLPTEDIPQVIIWDDYGQPGVLFAITNGRPQFNISTVANPAGMSAFGSKLIPGEWHHIAGVYDGSTVRIFLDGKDNTTGTYQLSGAILDNSERNPNDSPIGIGSDNISHTQLNFKGLIDELCIYNASLEPGQLAKGFFAK